MVSSWDRRSRSVPAGSHEFVEETHGEDLRGRVVPGDGVAVEPAAVELAGEVVLQFRVAGRVYQFLHGERGDLDPEQAARDEVLSRVAQEVQRVVRGEEAQERVEAADGQSVPLPQLRAPHVPDHPPHVVVLLSAPFDHRRRDLDRGHIVAGFVEGDRQASRPGAPLDDRT